MPVISLKRAVLGNAFFSICFLLASALSTSAYSKSKVAFLWLLNDQMKSKEKLVDKCIANIPRVTTYHINRKMSVTYEDLKHSESRINLLQELRNGKTDLFVIFRPDQNNPNMVKIDIRECKTDRQLYQQVLPFIYGEENKFCDKIQVAIKRAVSLYRFNTPYPIFIEPLSPDSSDIELYYVNNACEQSADLILKGTPGIQVLSASERADFNISMTYDSYDVFYYLSFNCTRSPSDNIAIRVGVKKKTAMGDILEQTYHLFTLAEFEFWMGEELPNLFEQRKWDGKELSASWSALARDYEEIGAWKYSCGIEEALLLMEYSNLNLTRLGDQYSLWMSERISSIETVSGSKRSYSSIHSDIYNKVGVYLRSLNIFERQLTLKELGGAYLALDHFRKNIGAANLRHSIPYILADDKHLGQNYLEIAESAEDRVVVNLMPKLLEKQWEFGQEVLIKAVLSRIDRTFKTKEDLDLIFKTITEIIPDQLTCSSDISQFLDHAWNFESGPRFIQYSPEDYENFIQNLLHADHKVANLYGEYALLKQSWANHAPKSESERISVNKAALSLMHHYEQTPYAEGIKYKRNKEWMYTRTSDIEFYSRSEKDKNHQSIESVYPEPEVLPQSENLLFNELDLQLVNDDRNDLQPIEDLLWKTYGGYFPLREVMKCGDKLDVFWQPGVILFMEKKDRLRVVLEDSEPIFDDLCWDGEFIWIATRRQGIWIMDTTGKVVRKIGVKEQLPKADNAIRLVSVGKRKVVAVGSFGEWNKAWMALITLKAQVTPKVDIFHRAEQIVRLETDKQKAISKNIGFVPTWIQPYSVYDKPVKKLLIGRESINMLTKTHPLIISLPSLEVETVDIQMAMSHNRNERSYLRTSEQLLVAGDHGVHAIVPVSDEHPYGYKQLSPKKTPDGSASYFNSFLLKFKDEIYAPGRNWIRFRDGIDNPEVLKHSNLTERFRYYGESAFYGMLMWDSANVFVQIVPVD